MLLQPLLRYAASVISLPAPGAARFAAAMMLMPAVILLRAPALRDVARRFLLYFDYFAAAAFGYFSPLLFLRFIFDICWRARVTRMLRRGAAHIMFARYCYVDGEMMIDSSGVIRRSDILLRGGYVTRLRRLRYYAAAVDITLPSVAAYIRHVDATTSF